jgi:hypothetical protein
MIDKTLSALLLCSIGGLPILPRVASYAGILKEDYPFLEDSLSLRPG